MECGSILIVDLVSCVAYGFALYSQESVKEDFLMESQLPTGLLAVIGTFLLFIVGLMNFWVFMRQLRVAKAQSDTAQKMLESAEQQFSNAQLQLNNTKQQLESDQQQRQIQLLQRAISEISDCLKIFVDKPYLRPYFYDNITGQHDDQAADEEIKTIAEIILTNYASSILHSALFPQYRFKFVEEVIKFHLHNSPALRDFLLKNFDRYNITGLTLLCLKNDTKYETERDLCRLIDNTRDIDDKKTYEYFLQELEKETEKNPLIFTKHHLDIS